MDAMSDDLIQDMRPCLPRGLRIPGRGRKGAAPSLVHGRGTTVWQGPLAVGQWAVVHPGVSGDLSLSQGVARRLGS